MYWLIKQLHGMLHDVKEFIFEEEENITLKTPLVLRSCSMTIYASNVTSYTIA